jgi:hypothetical protein
MPISLSSLPIQATNATLIDVYDQSPHRLLKMHDQQSLPRYLPTFSRLCTKHAMFFFAYKGDQYYHNV